MISAPVDTLASMNEFGKRLTMAMLRADVDRKGLAAHLNISVQAVGQAINAGKFSAENTAKAARFLQCNWYWLATGEETIEPGELHITPDDAAVIRRVLGAPAAAPQEDRRTTAGAKLRAIMDKSRQGEQLQVRQIATKNAAQRGPSPRQQPKNKGTKP